MVAYHGTVVRNLNVLQPFANPHSNLKYPCVYLSSNEALASIYIWNKPFKWMTFEIGADGIPIYNESFKNGLCTFYGGVRGCIYRCCGDFLVDENTTIKHAVVSKEPVSVSSAEIVEDAYRLILQNESKGLLKINHFEDLSEEQRLKDRNMILGAIKNLDLLKGGHPLSAFVSEKFPQLWNEASHMG